MNSTHKYDARPSRTFTRGSRLWTAYAVTQFLICLMTLVVYLLDDGLTQMAKMVIWAGTPIKKVLSVSMTAMLPVADVIAAVVFLAMVVWTLCAVSDCLQVRPPRGEGGE